jgi:hypothetical protein
MLTANPQPERVTETAAIVTESEKTIETVPTIKTATVGDLMPGLLRIYLPNYNPHDIEISPGIQVLADKRTEMAIKVS